MDVGSIGNDLCATPKLLTSFFISWSSHFHVMQLSNKKKTVYEQNKKNTKERRKERKKEGTMFCWFLCWSCCKVVDMLFGLPCTSCLLHKILIVINIELAKKTKTKVKSRNYQVTLTIILVNPKTSSRILPIHFIPNVV